MILVFVEHGPDGLVDTSLETLRFARDLGAAGGGIAVDAVGVGIAGFAAELGAHGVRTAYDVGGDDVAAYSGSGWAAGILTAREMAGAVVITGAGTQRGNEVLAHAAARVDAPMAANVVAFSGLAPFVVTRQVMGGAALEDMRLGHRPAIFSVAGHAVEASEIGGSAAHVVAVDPLLRPEDLVARVVSTAAGEADQSGNLKTARVVVGGGRGAGGPDGFGAVDELAGLLGATVGVSRVVTSLGWRPHHEQVGQTGSRISPELYIPCGISGAIQHWAGCSSSKAILAINTDAEAPMVTKATYAVVGDMHEVLPAIIEAIKNR